MNLNLTGAQVRCPNCSEIYYQTTDLYDPEKILTGEMLEWFPKYGENGFNWSLPFAAHDLSEAVLCEGCGSSIAPNGYLGLDRLHFPTGEFPAVLETEVVGIPVLNATEGEEEEEQPSILFDHMEPVQEEKQAEDPMAKYLTQKACPECGRFFWVDEWEAHLATHPPEVRERILKPPEAVDKTPSEPDQAKNKEKSKRIKVKSDINDSLSLQCPICEASFALDKQILFDSHLKTHELGGVQQAGK
jgi:uncharacterized Zn-finger protein